MTDIEIYSWALLKPSPVNFCTEAIEISGSFRVFWLVFSAVCLQLDHTVIRLTHTIKQFFGISFRIIMPHLFMSRYGNFYWPSMSSPQFSSTTPRFTRSAFPVLGSGVWTYSFARLFTASPLPPPEPMCSQMRCIDKIQPSVCNVKGGLFTGHIRKLVIGLLLTP